MISLTPEFKQKVAAALLAQRPNFDGTDQQFATQYGINGSVFSQIKNGRDLAGLLREAQWLSLGRMLDVALTERKWKMARTDVFTMIEEDVTFCQAHSKSLMFVDDCGIGKTYAAKYLARTLKNCFYVDGTQAKTKQQFVRLIARTVGADDKGRFVDVKANLKYVLRILPNPVVIIDEAGAPDYDALMEIMEFWNATEGACGWYLLGADGLRAKIERGIAGKKAGFAELFSRFNERYNSIVPTERSEKIGFYKKLITDVLSVNMKEKAAIPAIVKRCLTNDSGRISGLRRAESLAILHA